MKSSYQFYSINRPTFVEEAGVLDIAQGRHPIVSRALQKMSTAEYVPNDTNLKADEVRCMIITGPNMGGKSCLLSQVGIIVVLAQIGSFVPAARAKLSIFDSIFLRYELIVVLCRIVVMNNYLIGWGYMMKSTLEEAHSSWK